MPEITNFLTPALVVVPGAPQVRVSSIRRV